MSQDDLLTRLSRLLPSQFEEVLFRANVQTEHLPTGDAPQAMRAINAIRYLEQQKRLHELTQILDTIVLGPTGPAAVNPQVEVAKGSEVAVVTNTELEQSIDTDVGAHPIERSGSAVGELRHRSRGRMVVDTLIIGRWRIAVATIIITIGAVRTVAWMRSGTSAEVPNMARFRATKLHMGIYAAGAPPAECRQLAVEQDCGQWRHPESVDPTPVAAFYLDKKEVTNDDFSDWLNRTKNDWWPPADDGVVKDRQDGLPLVRTKECGDGLAIVPGGHPAVAAGSAKRPVTCVTWYGADKYCRALGKRLPHEAEWELAARGAEGRMFPWGSAPPRDGGVACDVNALREVGTSSQDISPDGIYDLAGNVSEWVTSDRDTPEMRSVRGGYFKSHGSCDLLGTKCARVFWLTFGWNVGFRCARDGQ